MSFVYGAVTLFGATFQTLPLPSSFVTLCRSYVPAITSHNPELATP